MIAHIVLIFISFFSVIILFSSARFNRFLDRLSLYGAPDVHFKSDNRVTPAGRRLLTSPTASEARSTLGLSDVMVHHFVAAADSSTNCESSSCDTSSSCDSGSSSCD